MATNGLIKYDTQRLSEQVTQTTHGFSALDAVRYNTGTSLWVDAQADSESNLATHIVVKVIDANNIEIAEQGSFVLDAAHGITLGQQRYLDASTAGANTATAPTIAQRLFVPVTATKIQVNVIKEFDSGALLPAGGSSSTILYKASGTDYDVSWSTGMVWDETNDFLGIKLGGAPGAPLHVGGNILIDASAEVGLQVKYNGDLNSNANISNPIWTLGRMVEGGVADKSVFRFIFGSDDVTERSVFEVEDTGTAASVSDGTRRSHFEAFLNNGDTQPIFRLSSAVGAGPDMGLQFGVGGTTAPDIEFYRNGANTVILALGGTAKNIWYADSLVFQPGYNAVFSNGTAIRTGTTAADAFTFQAYDVDGTSYTTFATLTAGNTPTFDLSASTTVGGSETIVTASSTDTLTNKTFDANGTGNSISNIDVADLANGTDGELITWDASGAPATVAVGTSGQVLTSNGAGAAPTFQDVAGEGGIPSSSTPSALAILDDTDFSSNTYRAVAGYGIYRWDPSQTKSEDDKFVVNTTSGQFSIELIHPDFMMDLLSYAFGSSPADLGQRVYDIENPPNNAGTPLVYRVDSSIPNTGSPDFYTFTDAPDLSLAINSNMFFFFRNQSTNSMTINFSCTHTGDRISLADGTLTSGGGSDFEVTLGGETVTQGRLERVGTTLTFSFIQADDGGSFPAIHGGVIVEGIDLNSTFAANTIQGTNFDNFKFILSRSG